MFYPSLLTSFKTVDADRTNTSKLITAAVQICVFVVFLVYTFLHIEKHKEIIETKEYKTKYGAFFTNVETYMKPSALHYTTLFLLRRLVIALTIAFLNVSSVLQSLVAVNTSLLMLSWLILVKPLDSNSKTYLEMANEFLILILGYFGFLFQHHEPSLGGNRGQHHRGFGGRPPHRAN